jgi:hypothetical protein
MGSSGQKRTRKANRSGRHRPQHLPKVGTATENRLEQEGERRAVMENIGIGPGTPQVWKWVIAVVAVAFVIAAIVALVAIN